MRLTSSSAWNTTARQKDKVSGKVEGHIQNHGVRTSGHSAATIATASAASESAYMVMVKICDREAQNIGDAHLG